LPFELRQIAAKYPVSLYTGDNCAPCMSARAMLTARGIPFVEKSVKTAEDSQALQRISGDNTLPFATIGAQQLKGFSDSEWTQFLNAAGYPAVSILPPSYRNPSATPLVAISAAPSATTNTGSNASTAPRPAARPVQPPPEAGNPSGIRF
jgi:glutaredoxin